MQRFQRSLKQYLKIIKDFDGKIIEKMQEKNRKLDISDGVIIALMVDAIELAEDAQILGELQRGASLGIIARTILEKLAYLQFLMMSNTKTRCERLFIFNKKKSNDLEKLITGETKDSERIIEEFGLNLDQIPRTAVDKIEYVEKRYKELLGDNKHWHIETANSTIFSVFEHVGMSAYYQTLYKIFSNEVHGLYTNKNVKLIDDLAYIKDADYDPGSIEVMILDWLRQIVNIVGKYYKMNASVKQFERQFAIYHTINYHLGD